MERVRVGIIGCGMISEIYLKNLSTKFSEVVDVVACADISEDATEARAAQFGIMAQDVNRLIASPEIELVVNLTNPAAHYDIAKRALLARKHVYSEKPMATTFDEGRELLELARERNLFVGAAPDTFLGSGLQTCCKLIEDGSIGTPVYALGLMLARGPEGFHPNPANFYKAGAGPMLDMGPYYLTALTAMFGPAKLVNGLAKSTFPTRKVLNPNSSLYQSEFSCDVDTFISCGVEFENGVMANIVTTWDLPFFYWKSEMPLLTVFGTEGMLTLPDPNTFGGISPSPISPESGRFVKLRRGDGEFEDIPLLYGYAENSRGLGVADMAWCTKNGGTPRVSGEMSLHVLEMMLGALEAARDGKSHLMQTKCQRPEGLFGDVPFNKTVKGENDEV